MRPRRSRFSRIYHHLTRRSVNRAAQWQQIGTLRKHGSLGHPAKFATSISLAADSPERFSDRLFNRPEGVPPLDVELEECDLEPSDVPQSSSPGAPAVAALVAALFLLACGYAAFAGWMHSIDDRFALLGILGAIGALIAAGAGIFLVASRFRYQFSCRFLSGCAISLAALYGALLFFAYG